MAVFVLESVDAPISIYDIRRGMEREFGFAPGRNSLNATVAVDRRCCWAGRGLYGLWRHGLVPGPRKLVDVTRLVLFAHEKSLTPAEAAFVLRESGYRFQQPTLQQYLASSDEFRLEGWNRYRVNRSPADGARLRGDLGLDLEEFREVVGRARRMASAGLRELRRRTAAERGLSAGDPVYVDGTVETRHPY